MGEQTAHNMCILVEPYRGASQLIVIARQVTDRLAARQAVSPGPTSMARGAHKHLARDKSLD